ncbi:MAG: 4-oxalocrotonate tautomerase [Alteromonadaceae bacterium]|jgi:4-oxalocrotonate tautomerase
MPIITIQQDDGRTTEQKAEVIKRITQTMVDVYGAKPASVTVFFQEFSDEQWGKDAQLNIDRKKNK